MDKLFLKAKHWQVFLLTVVLPMAAYALFFQFLAGKINELLNPNPDGVPELFKIVLTWMPYLFGIAFIAYLLNNLWMLAVGTGLQNHLPEEARQKTLLFKATVILPVVLNVAYFYFIYQLMTPMFMNPEEAFADARFIGEFERTFSVIMPFTFIGFAAVLYSMFFVAKTIKSAELQKDADLGDCIGEMFLIWFFIVGVWILQPRINKIAAGEIQDEEGDVLDWT